MKKLEERPTINEILMSTALLWAERSYSTRMKVGAVIAKEGRILAAGYNGTLPGESNCCEDEFGVTLNTVLHAEENALDSCLRHGISPKGAAIFLTLSPCEHCATRLINIGIKEVFYLNQYRNIKGIELIKRRGIKIININPNSMI